MQKNNFVLIIGIIPSKSNEKDGMIQRELAIDSILSNHRRIYVENYKKDFTFFNYPRKWLKLYNELKRNKLSHIKNAKFYKLVSYNKLYRLFKNASKIYVHSLHCLSWLPNEFVSEFKYKIIIDIHGCVVEEMEFYNIDKNVINNLKKTEALAFNSVQALIAVSNNMINFYRTKYPEIKTQFINLPIFNYLQPTNPAIITDSKKLKLIYSGRTQKWQNVDLMVETISKVWNNYDITILTPDIEEFNNKLKQYGIEDKVTIKSVSSSTLYKEYEKADLGFILRDDIIVNRVACPTKIIEYLQHGIIPVVLQPDIGDFNNLGYSFILNNDLVENKLPDQDKLYNMKLNNFKILNNLANLQKQGISDLLSLIGEHDV